jgi:hypothetical protein
MFIWKSEYTQLIQDQQSKLDTILEQKKQIEKLTPPVVPDSYTVVDCDNNTKIVIADFCNWGSQYGAPSAVNFALHGKFVGLFINCRSVVKNPKGA